MLETSKERVGLLKAGISAKTIEKLYLICNNFKIVGSPVLFELVQKSKECQSSFINDKTSAQYEEVSG
jgi:hypothetical protein